MEPRQNILQLLSQSAGKAVKPAMKFFGGPFMLLDEVTKAQPSFEKTAYSRFMIDPKNRFNYRDPDEDESYDMIAEAAMERRAKLTEIATLVRQRGGTAEQIQAVWKDPDILKDFEVGKNPGDLLRGAGRYIPKQNGNIAKPRLPKYNNVQMKLSPGYNYNRTLPAPFEQNSPDQMLINLLANMGLTDTRQ